MPANAVVRARLDLRLKQQAEAVLAAKGLTLSEVFRQLMMRIARDGKMPFEFIAATKEADQMNDLITLEMRHHSVTRSLNHFGFRGNRAAISALYARSATQHEVNEASRALGSPQEYYLNMLHQAINWGHKVWVWHDPARSGQVYQLVYNPDHIGPGSVAPPDNWREMNVLKAPGGATPKPYRPRRS